MPGVVIMSNKYLPISDLKQLSKRFWFCHS